MKLQYIGHLVKDMPSSPRLWNLIAPGHPSHGSSLSLESLKELGILKGCRP